MKQIFRYLFIFLLFFSVQTSAQNILDYTHEPLDHKKSTLSFDVEADYFSDAVQNSLVTKMLFGGTLDRESLSSMTNDMDGRNTFGGWMRAGVTYSALSDSIRLEKPIGLMLEFGVEGYGYSSFPKDVFHLAFLGNADRLGEVMSLSNTVSEAMLYQYAGLGLINESTGSYASFNLINVQSYFRSEIETLELFTAADASELAIDYDGEVFLNDSLRGDFLSNSGTGFTLNGRYNLKVSDDNDLFSLELRNLGFVSLNDRTRKFSADSTFQFNGININDVLSSNNPLRTISLEDSVAIDESQEGKTVVMPLDLKGAYFHRINDRDHLAISVRKRFFSEHSAELGFNYYHNEVEGIGYNVGLSYGGYGNLRMNAGAYVKLTNWNLYLTTKNLLGAFLNSAKGRSVSFGISRTFRPIK